MTFRTWLGLAGVAGLMIGATSLAGAQDSTTILSTFLRNLRGSHLIMTTNSVPVLSSCGDGALATGSNDTVGRVVGTTQTGCVLTFGSTYGPNSADCVFTNITANRGNVSANDNASLTISNLTAGDDFIYVCLGR